MKTLLRIISPALLAVILVASPAGASTAPIAITGPVTAATSTSVHLSGTVNPNGTATTWYFEYGPSEATGFPLWTASHSAGSGSSAVTVSTVLPKLASATSYNYRLVATSSAGTSYGATGVFNTSSAPTAVTISATDVSYSSATLNGIVNPEGATTTWYFQYGTTSNYGQVTATKTLSATPNNATITAQITNLIPRTTYHYRLVASNSSGTVQSPGLMFTTEQSLTLNVSPTTVVYGQHVALSGTVASGRAGVAVTVLAERFDQANFTPIARVSTQSDGRFTFLVQPSFRTSYEVSAAGGTSSPAQVSVRPVVFLNIGARGRLSTKVVAAQPFAFHVLQLQRLSHNLWVTWKHVRLNASAQATFSTLLPRGRTPVRMAIGPFVPGIDQAAPGYLAGFSRRITYVRHS